MAAGQESIEADPEDAADVAGPLTLAIDVAVESDAAEPSDPVATAAKTKPAQGKKIDWAGTNVRAYRAELSSRRNQFKQWLKTAAPKARVTGEFDISLNAVAVQLNGTSLATLRTSPLVTRAEYEGVYTPTAIDIDLERN